MWISVNAFQFSVFTSRKVIISKPLMQSYLVEKMQKLYFHLKGLFALAFMLFLMFLTNLFPDVWVTLAPSGFFL